MLIVCHTITHHHTPSSRGDLTGRAAHHRRGSQATGNAAAVPGIQQQAAAHQAGEAGTPEAPATHQAGAALRQPTQPPTPRRGGNPEAGGYSPFNNSSSFSLQSWLFLALNALSAALSSLDTPNTRPNAVYGVWLVLSGL